MAKRTARRQPKLIFRTKDQIRLQNATRDVDVPSEITVSQFFDTIAHSLIRLQKKVLQLEEKLRKSN
jgi:hypothetical protein